MTPMAGPDGAVPSCPSQDHVIGRLLAGKCSGRVDLGGRGEAGLALGHNVPMCSLSPLAQRIVHWLHGERSTTASDRGRPTVRELGAELQVDRRVLDHALGELDAAGLIRIRGGSTTHESRVELTEHAATAADQTPSRST